VVNDAEEYLPEGTHTIRSIVDREYMDALKAAVQAISDDAERTFLFRTGLARPGPEKL
jgi:hypothetical protein